jgi:integrase
LLLVFAAERLARQPSKLRLEDLDSSLLVAFLAHIEGERGCGPKTRNTRLTALRSFFRFVAFAEPTRSLQCQQVLTIPSKRHERSMIEFLTEDETAALVAAPDRATWVGRRDHTLLLVAAQTGLRTAELRSLRRCDVGMGTGAHVRCLGKGRKERRTPLRRDVAAALDAWLKEGPGGAAVQDPVFPSVRGGLMSADALQRLVARHVAAAATKCPTLVGRSITPHTLRHTAAMDLLRRGVDVTVIALWLGHESIESTQVYLHADMRLKERALAHVEPSGATPERFQPSDELLTFLSGL